MSRRKVDDRAATVCREVKPVTASDIDLKSWAPAR